MGVEQIVSIICSIIGVLSAVASGCFCFKTYNIKNSINETKFLNNNAVDYSQKATGDIVNVGCSGSEIVELTRSIKEITTSTVTSTLEQTYNLFKQQSDYNINCIMSETKRIIDECKLQISGYSKIDWINIYLESAKNIADEYMQNVWARVLAKELSEPGSFSFKTLDVLKNMSASDFPLLEKLLTFQINNAVYREANSNDTIMPWDEFQKLKEFGLLSLDNSLRTVEFQKETFVFLNDEYALILKSDKEGKQNIEYPCYLLTSAAIEIKKIVEIKYDASFLVKYGKMIKSKLSEGVKISLHRVIQQNAESVTYDSKNLLEEE